MSLERRAAGISNKELWASRIINALLLIFLAFDCGVKILKLPAAMQGTVRLGYPAQLVLPIGVAELICIVLFAIPRTCVLGAVLLTGYLGGATATQVRLQDPWFFFPLIFGVLVWGVLFLRDVRLRALIPFQRYDSTT